MAVMQHKHQKAPASHNAAFSLVELLIGLVIISFMMIAGVSLVISFVQTGSRQEAFLRLQSKWSLLQYLLNNEIQESVVAQASGSNLSLSIPYGNPPSCTTLVTFALNSGNLTRSGPSVSSDGSLALPTSSSSCATVSIIQSTVLTGVTSFSTSMTTASSQRVSYSVTFTDPTGVQFTDRGTASTGASRIIN